VRERERAEERERKRERERESVVRKNKAKRALFSSSSFILTT
jgi:hypothetical protein